MRRKNNLDANELQTCMNAMEIAFARMHWDFVAAFQEEGMSVKEIPDDLHEACKAMNAVKDYINNCCKLLRDVEKTNAKKRREERG